MGLKLYCQWQTEFTEYDALILNACTASALDLPASESGVTSAMTLPGTGRRGDLYPIGRRL